MVAVASTVDGVHYALASEIRSHGGTLECCHAQERHLEWAMICECSSGDWSVVWRAVERDLGKRKVKGSG